MALRPALLFELPRLPKGVLALSLPAVAAALDPWLEPHLFDLDVTPQEAIDLGPYRHAAMCGLKVSTQSLEAARRLTAHLRAQLPDAIIVWGGEYPTLEPEEALVHADSIVLGPVETVAGALAADVLAGVRGQRYTGTTAGSLAEVRPPRLDLVRHRDRYWQFMGLPLETSRGCDQHCTFCMVHTMQPRMGRKTGAQLDGELEARYGGHFVNVIDYNLGVDREHALAVARHLGRSGAAGWMGELTLAALDDDELLAALSDSGCRMVYCGLETLDPDGLRSVAKRGTNEAAGEPLAERYRRLIRKAQSHGVEVAAGLILGLRGTTEEGLHELLAFLEDTGVIYVKLTFLTYSPGTRARTGMLRQGRYLSEDAQHADGHHLTWLADGVDPEVVYAGARRFIRRFYGLRSIWRRSAHVASLARRLEFVLFNLCFREAYRAWLRHEVLQPDAGRFDVLLHTPMRSKPLAARLAERALTWLRRRAIAEAPTRTRVTEPRWHEQSELPS